MQLLLLQTFSSLFSLVLCRLSRARKEKRAVANGTAEELSNGTGAALCSAPIPIYGAASVQVEQTEGKGLMEHQKDVQGHAMAIGKDGRLNRMSEAAKKEWDSLSSQKRAKQRLMILARSPNFFIFFH